MEQVSVVIPLYNKAPHVERAIRSVLGQTWTAFELIVVDDGSTDEGAAIVESLGDKRIRLIRQTNQGVSAARNRGISAANTEWIGFLDADDEWAPEFLQTVLSARVRCPTAKLIGSAYSVVDKAGRAERLRFENVPNDVGLINNWFEAAIKHNPICPSSVLIKKEVFDLLGGFPVDLRRGEDEFMWCKIALAYDLAFVHDALVTRYRDAVNRTSGLPVLYDFPLIEYMRDQEIRPDPGKAYFIHEFVYKKHLRNATRAIILGQYQQARSFISKAKHSREFRWRVTRLRTLAALPDWMIGLIVDRWMAAPK